jgi:hypothetical protein
LQDWQIRICVFPYRQEILIRLTAFGSFAFEREGARKAEARQRI